jgi:hypothetical protein
MNFLPSYTLVLSNQDVQKNVNSVGLNQIMEALIEQLSTAMINDDQKQTIIPLRSGFNYHHPRMDTSLQEGRALKACIIF